MNLKFAVEGGHGQGAGIPAALPSRFLKLASNKETRP